MTEFSVTLKFTDEDDDRFYNVMSVYLAKPSMISDVVDVAPPFMAGELVPTTPPISDVVNTIRDEETPISNVVDAILQTSDLVDVHDVPWNGEFHSANKSFNGDGTWRRKRGVAKDAADEYEGQYYQAPQPGVPTSVTGWAIPTISFDDVNILAGRLIADGKLKMDALVKICADEGVTNPTVDLPRMPDACAKIHAKLTVLA
jgi:hypothetical protein